MQTKKNLFAESNLCNLNAVKVMYHNECIIYYVQILCRNCAMEFLKGKPLLS